MINREAIYSALFAKLQGVAGFVTVSRRLRMWADVSPAEQPALFQAQRRESIATTPGLNKVITMEVDVYLYAHTGGDRTKSPSETINPLLDAVLAALAPDPITNKQRLGGLVEHCWVEGSVETDEGLLGDQGVAILPVIIKVTESAN